MQVIFYDFTIFKMFVTSITKFSFALYQKLFRTTYADVKLSFSKNFHSSYYKYVNKKKFNNFFMFTNFWKKRIKS